MPRRSSYASVVAGGEQGRGINIPMASSSPARSGALAHLINPTGSTPRSRPSHNNGEESGSGPGSMQSGSWTHNYNTPIKGGTPSLSSASRQYAFLLPNGHSTLTPSYLRHSRYLERLAEANQARAAAAAASAKDFTASTHSSNGGSLSTSSSSVNLHKMAPSHRGMTYDIVEKEPSPLEDAVPPLPSRWNESDKYEGIELDAEQLEVRFTGPGRSPENQAAAVRADFPMPPQCGIFYFEVTVLSKGKEGSLIGLGFSGPNVTLARLPGWEPSSWAYHGDDGRSFCCQSTGKEYGPRFSMHDVVGCGINFRTGCAFFTKNGLNLGTAFREIRGKLFPAVGMKKPGEHIKANFGQTPFVFDIDGMMAEEKRIIESEVEQTVPSGLHPPLDESSLMQALVGQFLAHDGYVETARAFTDEVRASNDALGGDEAAMAGIEAKEDLEAVNRQRIRHAILDGDVDKAFKLTTAYYPNVLKDNEQIYFRLRCRKFIEMIRQCSELQIIARSQTHSHSSSPTRKKGSDPMNGPDGGYGATFEGDMEIDDSESGAATATNGWEESASSADRKYSILMEETIRYGQSVRSEFRDDGRKEIQKTLAETFSLLAYEDPKNSVVAHLLEPEGRVPVAEELNAAILVSLGKSSSAALERVYQQTEVLVSDLAEEGGPGAFINVRKDCFR